MKNIFPEYFVSDEDRLEALWDQSLVVLDTNVLLDLYRYSDSARLALIDVLKALGDRLWIPHQVAHEYFENRLGVISSQGDIYSGIIKELNATKAKFNVASKHPFVTDSIFKEYVASFDVVVKDLDEKLKIHGARVSSDDIKQELSELFDGKVGSAFSEQEFNDVITEGEVRFREGIPPGFEDASKFSDAKTKILQAKKFGDLLLWKQILTHASATGTSVILVTGEKKKDWWLKQKERDLVGPLPALVKEFKDVVGKDFYLYSTDRFLGKANHYLKRHTSQTVLDEVKAVNAIAVEYVYPDSEMSVLVYKKPFNSALMNRVYFWGGDKRRTRDTNMLEDIESSLEHIQDRIDGLTEWINVKGVGRSEDDSELRGIKSELAKAYVKFAHTYEDKKALEKSMEDYSALEGESEG
jgi:hypothetical protein